MPTTPPRRFTLLDAMILVAGVGVGEALTKAYVDRMDQVRSMFGEQWKAPPWFREWIQAGSILLGAVALALLACRLLPPRPRPPRILRQPGMTASVAVALSCLDRAVETLFVMRRLPFYHFQGGPIAPIHYFAGGLAASPPTIGLAVLMTWVTLALGRWWRPEPSWIDRAGRLLGAIWIASYLYQRAGFLRNWFGA